MFHGSFSQELDGATSPDIERVMWPYLWQKGFLQQLVPTNLNCSQKSMGSMS